jgi:hypothetical protein
MRRSFFLLLAGAAALVVVGLRPWVGQDDDASATTLALTTPGAVKTLDLAPTSPVPPLRAVAERRAAISASPVPPGLSAEQWARVEARWQGRPDAAAERDRLYAYFSWQDAARRWRADPTDAVLAAEVRTGLPARLAQREVSAVEARQLEATLLAVLEPDPARREAALKAFDAAQPSAAPPDARTRAFLREQAALVAAWRSTPTAQRDAAVLQTELDRLRRVHFTPTPASRPENPR